MMERAELPVQRKSDIVVFGHLRSALQGCQSGRAAAGLAAGGLGLGSADEGAQELALDLAAMASTSMPDVLRNWRASSTS
jgi:hypothetical protein